MSEQNDNGSSLPRTEADAVVPPRPTPEQQARIERVLDRARAYLEAIPGLLPAGDALEDEALFREIQDRQERTRYAMSQWALEQYARDTLVLDEAEDMVDAAGVDATPEAYWARALYAPRVRRALELMAWLGQLGDPVSVIGDTPEEEEAAWLEGEQ